MGENGKVIGIDHIKGLVDFSISNIKKDKPWLLESKRIKLLGNTFLYMACYTYLISYYLVGDGRLGHPQEGPFDAIHVGAAAPTLPYEVFPYRINHT